MRRFSTFRTVSIGIAMCTTLAGCYVQSLRPLYSDSIVTYDGDLVGTWASEEDDEFTFTLEDTARGMYTLISSESGSTARFQAVLVDIEGVEFMDILPEEPSNDNGFYKDHLLRVHNILRVERKADTLSVADFDPEWFSTMASQKKVTVDNVPLDGAVLLTATTPDLQSFVRKFAHTPEAFSEPVRLIRTR
jgi:hypothetical protein